MTTTTCEACLVLALAAVACAPGGAAPSPRPGGFLETPTDPPAVTAGCGSVTLALPPSASGDAATVFRVERSADGGSTWTTVADLPAGGTTTLQDQPAQPLQFRYFAHRMTSESGSSPVATAVPLAPPDAPTAVVALPGSSRATVSWQPPASDHGSPLTQAVLADQEGVGNVDRFLVDSTATRAVVGDEEHPLLPDHGSWSFRVSATNQCGTATSDPSPAILTSPWNATPEGDLPLGTKVYAMGSAQVAGTEYLVGGLDSRLQTLGLTLRTSPDPALPADGRLLPWRESGVLNVPRAYPAVSAVTAVE
ncbi:MAG: hypothetical protein ACXWLM_02590, partial [Myxococcales bacterium]